MGEMFFKEIIEKLRTIEIEYDEKIEEILKGSREPEIIERVKKLSEESLNIFNLILDLFDDKDEGYELIFHILAIIVKDVLKERNCLDEKMFIEDHYFQNYSSQGKRIPKYNDLIDLTRSDFLDIFFLKVLKIIIRINEIGLNLTNIKRPSNLVAKLQFNSQNINLEELYQEEVERPRDSQEDKQKKILNKLRRIEKRLDIL